MTTPHYADDAVTLYHGDCLDVLRDLPDASVDAVVTDPPYELGFMGKGWDTTGVAYRVDLWRECLRVLKPGGHLLAFGGTRTWHRLACAIEDAGFEVRDSIAWLYGQGFPKSLNVSRALDDVRCRCQMGESEHGEQATEHDVPRLRGGDVPAPEGAERGPGTLLLEGLSEPGAPAARRTELPADADGAGEPGVEGRRDVQAAEGELHRPEVRPVPAGVRGDGAGRRVHHGAPPRDGDEDRSPAPAVGSGEPHQPRPEGQPAGEPRAVPVERGPQAWRGWPVCGRCGKPSIPDGLGTAAKPAFEPVVVARRPLAGTVAANVLAHGTGGLNIDGCRIGDEERWNPSAATNGESAPVLTTGPEASGRPAVGRWPANVILDESQAAELDRQSGPAGSNSTAPGSAQRGMFGDRVGGTTHDTRADGGASRFFYVAKAPTSERPRVKADAPQEAVIERSPRCAKCGYQRVNVGESVCKCAEPEWVKEQRDYTAHPTVKPLDLMRWLVRLVTPPGGVVLDPFVGSGTTAEACVIEGFKCVAIEREADYLPLIVQRLTKPIQPDLFGGAA